MKLPNRHRAVVAAFSACPHIVSVIRAACFLVRNEIFMTFNSVDDTRLNKGSNLSIGLGW